MKPMRALTMLAGLISCQQNKPGAATGTTASADEAKQYIKQLALSDFDMKASESYGSQELVEMAGNITNNGPHPLQRVDPNCVFAEPSSQPGLVLMDLRIPAVHDGLDQIHALNDDIPTAEIIVLSGHTSDLKDNLRMAETGGAESFTGASSPARLQRLC